MRVKSGRMIVVPYELGVNDIRVFIRENHTPEQYYRMVCDHFDTLYKDSESGGRVLCLPLHPFVIGLPFRIKYLDKALDYMCSHEGVWRTTGGRSRSGTTKTITKIREVRGVKNWNNGVYGFAETNSVLQYAIGLFLAHFHGHRNRRAHFHGAGFNGRRRGRRFSARGHRLAKNGLHRALAFGDRCDFHDLQSQ